MANPNAAVSLHADLTRLFQIEDLATLPENRAVYLTVRTGAIAGKVRGWVAAADLQRLSATGSLRLYRHRSHLRRTDDDLAHSIAVEHITRWEVSDASMLDTRAGKSGNAGPARGVTQPNGHSSAGATVGWVAQYGGDL